RKPCHSQTEVVSRIDGSSWSQISCGGVRFMMVCSWEMNSIQGGVGVVTDKKLTGDGAAFVMYINILQNSSTNIQSRWREKTDGERMVSGVGTNTIRSARR